MFYHEIIDGKTVTHEVESLPPEIEAFYAEVRQKYTIRYERIDWADDDTDAGMGYDYDNSYSFFGAPTRHELVLKDGALYGFWVGFNSYYPGYSKPEMLIPGEIEEVTRSSGYSSKYGNSTSWKLITETVPAPCQYCYLLEYPHQNRDDVITAADFAGDWVEEVVWRDYIQDHRGHFDNASRLKVKLTAKGIANPDDALKALAAYHPFLVRQ